MAKYELLVGSHVISGEPLEVVQAPAVVESDRDLVAAFGSEKFKLVEGSDEKPVAKKGAKAE